MKDLQPPPAVVTGGSDWTWLPRSPATNGEDNALPWVRVFHLGSHCPSPDFRRRFGPIHRFDHHTGRTSNPRDCLQGRTIIYLARDLGTALAEVFGDEPAATVCPNYRVSLLQVTAECRLQDLTGLGTSSIGALPSLCTGPLSRRRTQEWARAIHRDQPAGAPIDGVHYRSAHVEGPCLALFERSPGLEEIPSAHCPVGGVPLMELANDLITLLHQQGKRYVEISADDCARCRSGH